VVASSASVPHFATAKRTILSWTPLTGGVLALLAAAMAFNINWRFHRREPIAVPV